jgi:hypothetical protein
MSYILVRNSEKREILLNKDIVMSMTFIDFPKAEFLLRDNREYPHRSIWEYIREFDKINDYIRTMKMREWAQGSNEKESQAALYMDMRNTTVSKEKIDE